VRERRRKLAQDPGKLMETVRYGAEKATKTAEETMAAAREAIGLLQIDAVKTAQAPEKILWLTKDEPSLRVPESAATASTDKQRREIIASAWAESVSRLHPLRKDKPDTFITRKGRRVGVHSARQDNNGNWEFSFPERTLNVLVLLAEENNGILSDYVLPPKFLQENGRFFEREDSGAGVTVRVSVKRDSDGASIRIKDTDLRIQKGDYSPLQ
jgi:hypothetical protein